jgi:hypothetical protein
VEAAGTEVAAAFTVADLAFAEADLAGVGSAFSVHTPTVTIPTIMLITTRAVAIWSLGGSLRLAQPDSCGELVHMNSLLGFVTLIGSATEQVLGYFEHHYWFFGVLVIGYIFHLRDNSLHARFGALDKRLDEIRKRLACGN